MRVCAVYVCGGVVMENSHDVFVASPLLLISILQLPLPPSLTFPFVSVPLSIHTSESQQEFFRMLDEKIEKVRRPEVGFVGEGCSEGGAGHLK